MANSKTKGSCFIIMPITTPKRFVERYKDDAEHFAHVLEHLFIPALLNAGFEPVPPKTIGSDLIQAEIIKQLSLCELVLCDMSILNPNVFFEFGIRTSLNKPVALVVDDKTENIPFDTSIINFHRYGSSLDAWSIESEINKLEEHIKNAYKKTKDHNALWKYFGVAQTGMFKPEDAEMGEKFDLIIQELSTIKLKQEESEKLLGKDYIPADLSGVQQYYPKYSVYDPFQIYMKKTQEEMLEEILQLLRSNVEKTAKEDKPSGPDSNNP